MLHYSEYNLNDRGTLLALLIKGLPKDNMKQIENKHKLSDLSILADVDTPTKGLDNPIAKANGFVSTEDDDGDEDDSNQYSLDGILGSTEIDHVSTSYAKTLLYAFALDCNQHQENEGVETCDKKDYNGVFVQSTNDIIVDNPDYVYYAQFDTKGTNGVTMNIQVYDNDRSILDAIWVHELYQIKSVPLGRPDKAINALKSLWISQSTKSHIDKQADPSLAHSKKAAVPKPFMHLFSELLVNITSVDKSQAGPINCTYAELVEFYHEVRNGKLTSKTRNVQEWLFSQRTQINRGTRADKILQILQLRPNYNQVINGVKEIPKARIPKLCRAFQSDRCYGRRGRHYGFHLAHVYKMDYPQKQIHGAKHVTLVHGTNSSSIPTIIFDGLKTHDELVRDHASNYEDTGQAMGEGVYMACPSQCSKSLNYSNYSGAKYKFLIITDVAYNKPAYTDDYEIPSKPYDMIFADSVGPSQGYNEYLARYSNQIRIKYILAFAKNHRKKK